jgi:hypothetical protein
LLRKELSNERNMIMTTSLEAIHRDFKQVMQMLTGAWVTQIAGAVASYSIAESPGKGTCHC